MTFKRGDKAKAVHDVALGEDIVIRTGCPHLSAHRYAQSQVRRPFYLRDDVAENEFVVKGLVDTDLEHAG